MDNLYQKNCANKLKKIRKEYNLTQEELAKILNTSKQSISLYEKGKMLPSINVLIALSKYFNISIDSFIFDKKENQINFTSDPAFVDNVRLELKAILDLEKTLNSYIDNFKKLTPIIKNRIDNLNHLILNNETHSNNTNDLIKVPLLRRNSLKKSDLFMEVIGDKLNPANNYYIFTVNDNSMDKFFTKDELILVEETDIINTDDLIVVKVGNDVFCRKVFIDGTSIILFPASSSLSFKSESYNTFDLVILGKVLGKTSDFLSP
ncbi:helix-turn-helix domain-containing protein [Clostridium sp. Sa3CUN1]|uniref:Helix-turn-helix domain-containing protein n=1 Tax=Clostridium gallinarum TaxID=2762246 RepID=A0ABR8Q614_9CLOT|nr:helix-turn-helix domain-containing protein [Clostridium gallinarum]MBD7915853.1 helix-turn-helix domain-containing protein [Clostridium gallinarum]